MRASVPVCWRAISPLSGSDMSSSCTGNRKRGGTPVQDLRQTLATRSERCQHMAGLLPTRPTYHHGDLRNSLIQAALTLVAERGVDGFSLRGAARTVGVSPSACYRHFADREALLAAVAHEGLDKLAADMRTAAAPYPDVTPHDAVRRFWSYSSAYLHFA